MISIQGGVRDRATGVQGCTARLAAPWTYLEASIEPTSSEALDSPLGLTGWSRDATSNVADALAQLAADTGAEVFRDEMMARSRRSSGTIESEERIRYSA